MVSAAIGMDAKNGSQESPQKTFGIEGPRSAGARGFVSIGFAQERPLRCGVMELHLVEAAVGG